MFEGLKVLLVEDDPTVREGSEQALQLAGLDVLAFHSAELAYKLLTPDFPGIVVSDVRLPGMSGLELLQAVKTLDPHLPVILVTGHGDITMAVHAMRTGAYDFIEKPYSSDQLVDVILRAGNAAPHAGSAQPAPPARGRRRHRVALTGQFRGDARHTAPDPRRCRRTGRRADLWRHGHGQGNGGPLPA
jgi:DNA-binding NtrC family response regulator